MESREHVCAVENGVCVLRECLLGLFHKSHLECMCAKPEVALYVLLPFIHHFLLNYQNYMTLNIKLL